MRRFTYTIQDKVGIHARPAGLLAKAARALDSVATIEKADGAARCFRSTAGSTNAAQGRKNHGGAIRCLT